MNSGKNSPGQLLIFRCAAEPWTVFWLVCERMSSHFHVYMAAENIPVEKAIIDAGITPYPYNLLVRRLLALTDPRNDLSDDTQ